MINKKGDFSIGLIVKAALAIGVLIIIMTLISRGASQADKATNCITQGGLCRPTCLATEKATAYYCDATGVTCCIKTEKDPTSNDPDGEDGDGKSNAVAFTLENAGDDKAILQPANKGLNEYQITDSINLILSIKGDSLKKCQVRLLYSSDTEAKEKLSTDDVNNGNRYIKSFGTFDCDKGQNFKIQPEISYALYGPMELDIIVFNRSYTSGAWTFSKNVIASGKFKLKFPEPKSAAYFTYKSGSGYNDLYVNTEIIIKIGQQTGILEPLKCIFIIKDSDNKMLLQTKMLNCNGNEELKHTFTELEYKQLRQGKWRDEEEKITFELNYGTFETEIEFEEAIARGVSTVKKYTDILNLYSEYDRYICKNNHRPVLDIGYRSLTIVDGNPPSNIKLFVSCLDEDDEPYDPHNVDEPTSNCGCKEMWYAFADDECTSVVTIADEIGKNEPIQLDTKLKARAGTIIEIPLENEKHEYPNVLVRVTDKKGLSDSICFKIDDTKPDVETPTVEKNDGLFEFKVNSIKDPESGVISNKYVSIIRNEETNCKNTNYRLLSEQTTTAQINKNEDVKVTFCLKAYNYAGLYKIKSVSTECLWGTKTTFWTKWVHTTPKKICYSCDDLDTNQKSNKLVCENFHDNELGCQAVAGACDISKECFYFSEMERNDKTGSCLTKEEGCSYIKVCDRYEDEGSCKRDSCGAGYVPYSCKWIDLGKGKECTDICRYVQPVGEFVCNSYKTSKACVDDFCKADKIAGTCSWDEIYGGCVTPTELATLIGDRKADS